MTGRTDPEAGQVSILLIGMVAVALTVVLGVVGVTSVQLARIHLLDAADAAALDASDALDEVTAYSTGVGTGVPLTDAGVAQAASDHLAARALPSRLTGWQVAAGTGTPDGRTAVVVLSGGARVPVASSVLSAFGGSVPITVTSTARSDLEP
ncbi:pilus assembly protein TadG-related protein [Ornithinimicrobium sp. W1679]|uniref:pilus assembly protein TadG-related protein n=1 Tax=Ornithinimicrobium sp. W1679 TaxID=3418770 RepID=UPI003CEF4F53